MIIQDRNRNCAWLHITGIAPLRGSLRAAPHRTGVPTLVLSSQDRSATTCFLDGWTRSPPYLPLLCRYLHRWILALPPVLLPILCLYKAHQRMYFRFWIFTWEGEVIGKASGIPHLILILSLRGGVGSKHTTYSLLAGRKMKKPPL